MQMRRSRHSVRNALAQQIRQAYLADREAWCRQRKQKNTVSAAWDKPQYGKGEPRTLWEKLAEFFLREQISDFVAFIHLQVQEGGSGARPLEPTQCVGPRALERWKQRHASTASRIDRVPAIQLAFKIQSEALHACLFDEREAAKLQQRDTSEEQLLRGALLDESVEMSGLFRYCIATGLTLEDVAEEYFSAALSQYLLDRQVYDAAWGERIPQPLRDEAARQLSWSEDGGRNRG